MKFKLIIHRPAKIDLRDAYQYAKRTAPLTSQKWLERFQHHIETLREYPRRCGFAYENSSIAEELRELRFGRRLWSYRIVFMIEGDTVRVLRIRRAQQRHLTRRQIRDAFDDE